MGVTTGAEKYLLEYKERDESFLRYFESRWKVITNIRCTFCLLAFFLLSAHWLPLLGDLSQSLQLHHSWIYRLQFQRCIKTNWLALKPVLKYYNVNALSYEYREFIQFNLFEGNLFNFFAFMITVLFYFII